MLYSVGRNSDKGIYIYLKIEYAYCLYECIFNLNTVKGGAPVPIQDRLCALQNKNYAEGGKYAL